MKTENYKFKLVFLIFSFFFFLELNAQTEGAAINTSGAAPDPSALLDISSNTKGVLIPRLSEAEKQSVVNPAFGLMIVNTTTGCINIWLGTTWKQICGDCDFSAPTPTSNSPVCEQNTITLFATYIPGASYTWVGPNGFSSSDQNPVINNVGLSAAGMYSVTATLNACTSQAQNIYVSVNPKPSIPLASNDGPECLGGAVNLSATAAPGVIYNWFGPGAFSSNMQNIPINNVQFSDSGLYSVFVTANSCNSDTAYSNLSVITVPDQPSSISGPVAPCEGSSGIVYSVASVVDVSYNWTVPSGWLITSGQGSSSITLTAGSVSGYISVIPSNTCGYGDSIALAVAPLPMATGGAISHIPGYRVHTFTAGGQFTVNSNCNGIDVEVLVVAGGGGGGYNHSGGGGGGGVVYNNATGLASGQIVNVVIGTGGAGGRGNVNGHYQGDNGGNSAFGAIIAYGGGGGGSRHDGAAPLGEGNGAVGGSGGGGGGRDAGNTDYLGGNPISGQGFKGGNGFRDSFPASGGGGGGAGAAGANANSYRGGDGGSGISNNITGTSVFYGGGGGGGSYGPSGGIAGTGGPGGGGNGSAALNVNGYDGTTNTGGGGGGAIPNGGDGGSGVVIVRYSIP
jgi:hypothetical protein